MTSHPDVTIRADRPSDESALRRLAALDSQRPLTGELLVADVGGELVAAHAPATGRAVADPFRRTADVVEMLRVRAAGPPRPQPHRGLPRFYLPRIT